MECGPVNAILSRLGTGERWWAAEVALRLCGIVLLGLCALSTMWLYRSVHQPPAHEASAPEMLAAFLTVQSWCLSSTLIAVGPGLFTLVPVPRSRGTIHF